MARRKRKKKKSRRKTYRLKRTAKAAAPRGGSVYKVKGGWRVSRARKRKARKRKRRRRGNPGGWPCE